MCALMGAASPASSQYSPDLCERYINQFQSAGLIHKMDLSLHEVQVTDVWHVLEYDHKKKFLELVWECEDIINVRHFRTGKVLAKKGMFHDRFE